MLAALLNRHPFTSAAATSDLRDVHDFLTTALWRTDPMGIRAFHCPLTEYAPESALILYALVHGQQAAAALDLTSGLVGFFENAQELPATLTFEAFASAYELSFLILFSLPEGYLEPPSEDLFREFLAVHLIHLPHVPSAVVPSISSTPPAAEEHYRHD